MGLFSSLFDRHLVGLDIGVSGIKAVELSGKAPRLVAYNRVPLPWNIIGQDGEIQERDVVVKALRKLFELRSFTSRRVAVGAAGNSIMTKKITVQKMSAAEFREQLYWEAEQYIPFDVNEVNLDFAIIGANTQIQSDTQMMDVLVVAAKKDYVSTLTGVVEEAGLTPEIVDNQAFALGNVFEFNYGHVTNGGGGTSVIVDVGAGSTKISVVEGDKVTFSRELRQSGILCTQMINEHMGITPEQAERLKIQEPNKEGVRDVILEFNRSLVDEIQRTLDYSISHNPEHSIQGIYVCGGGARTEGLFASLEERMTAPVQPLNPVQNMAGSGKKMDAGAIRELSVLGSVAIGLALRMEGDG